ncbi:sialoglycan-binding domain-containing protein [Umbribacter vaginalis]
MSALLSVSCIAAQNTSAAVADETSSPSSAINHTNQQSQPSIHTNENAPSSNNASASTHHNSAQATTSIGENTPSTLQTNEQNDATAMPFMILARSIDANATHNLDRSSADDGWGTNKQAWLVEPNILEFQRYRAVNSNGSIMSPGADGVGDWNTTTKKSDMYAHIKTENNGDRYLVFDVFFNNDAKSMLNNSALQQYTWQIPWAVADLNYGAYKGDTLRNLSIEAYVSNADTASNAVLSRDFERFSRDNTNSKTGINPLSNDQEFGGTTYKYDLGARVKASREEDLRTLFHKNAGDGVLRNATELPEPYRNYSYGIGVRTTAVDRAFHLHCEVKLRKDATIADIQDAYTWANTSSFGKTTNSAYTFVSGREKGGSENNLPRVISDKEAPKLYFNGKELTDTQTIDVYQGDKLSLKFGASDNSGSITNLHVSGLPQNKGIDDKTKHAASKEKPYTTSLNDVEFSNKNGNSPNEKVYNVVVSATDASGNKTEKTIRYNLKNLNHKYAEPTGSKLTVPWGHTFTDDEILKK